MEGNQDNIRTCSVTGEEIEEGFVYLDGEKYFKNESDLIKQLREDGNDENNELSDDFLLKDCYEAGVYYYTQWE